MKTGEKMKFITRMEREKSKIELYKAEKEMQKNKIYIQSLIYELSQKEIYKNRIWYLKKEEQNKEI